MARLGEPLGLVAEERSLGRQSGRRLSRASCMVSALLQVPAGALDGELLFVQQSLHFQYQLNILALVQALIGARLFGREHREFRFPVTQHMRLEPREAAHVADAEVKLVRDLHGL